MARTVLVADDSPSIQKKASGILTGEGFEVVTVSNGVAAIKKLPTVKPMIVLADVSMPGKDGYEVCEFVKNSPELKHVPVLLVFSDMEEYNATKGAQVRADGTIKKRTSGTQPFDPVELVSTILRFLAQAEAAAAPPPVAVNPPPERTFVTEPVDEEPVFPTREKLEELESLSEGMALGEPSQGNLSDAPFGLPEPPAHAPIMEAEISGGFGGASWGDMTSDPAPAEPVLSEEPAATTPPPSLGERTMVFRVPAEIAEPRYVEEAPAEPPPPSAPPAAERTMMFRMPADIAQPVWRDETVAPAAEPEPLQLTEPEYESPVAATTLESFSLTEATTGHVRFAAPGENAPAEAAPAYEAEAAAPEAPAAEVPARLEAHQIYAIVHKTVVKMSPPALSPQVIEDISKRLSEEIVAELLFESSGY